jgi:hypothetical protein
VYDARKQAAGAGAILADLFAREIPKVIIVFPDTTIGRRANLAACSELAGPYLDSFEHDGTLGAIGMTIRGEPAFGRGSRATALYSGRSACGSQP